MANKFSMSLIPSPVIFYLHLIASYCSTEEQTEIRSQLPTDIFLSFTGEWYYQPRKYSFPHPLPLAVAFVD